MRYGSAKLAWCAAEANQNDTITYKYLIIGRNWGKYRDSSGDGEHIKYSSARH